LSASSLSTWWLWGGEGCTVGSELVVLWTTPRGRQLDLSLCEKGGGESETVTRFARPPDTRAALPRGAPVSLAQLGRSLDGPHSIGTHPALGAAEAGAHPGVCWLGGGGGEGKGGGEGRRNPRATFRYARALCERRGRDTGRGVLSVCGFGSAAVRLGTSKGARRAAGRPLSRGGGDVRFIRGDGRAPLESSSFTLHNGLIIAPTPLLLPNHQHHPPAPLPRRAPPWPAARGAPPLRAARATAGSGERRLVAPPPLLLVLLGTTRAPPARRDSTRRGRPRRG
jgi:hypothetical protein